MKKETLYRCEICNTQYADKDKAMQCEKGHKIPSSVVGTRYLAMKSDMSGYPNCVDVTFTDGTTQRYKR